MISENIGNKNQCHFEDLDPKIAGYEASIKKISACMEVMKTDFCNNFKAYSDRLVEKRMIQPSVRDKACWILSTQILGYASYLRSSEFEELTNTQLEEAKQSFEKGLKFMGESEISRVIHNMKEELDKEIHQFLDEANF
jgi:hypothetical protein